MKTINIIQSSFLLLFNVVLFTIITSRKVLRSRISNQLFLHLQIIHMIIGVLRIVSCYKISSEIISNGLLISMFINLLLTSAYRLAALKFPTKYKLLTNRIVMCALLMSWTPSICFSVTTFLNGVTEDQLRYIHTLMIAVASGVLMSTTILMFIVIKKHQQFFRTNSRWASNLRGKKCSRNLKATYICIAIVMNFIVCWLPHCVHDIIKLTSSWLDSLYVDNIVDIVVTQLALLNSLSDPVLFICLSASTQKELKKLFRPGYREKRIFVNNKGNYVMVPLHMRTKNPTSHLSYP